MIIINIRLEIFFKRNTLLTRYINRENNNLLLIYLLIL